MLRWIPWYLLCAVSAFAQDLTGIERIKSEALRLRQANPTEKGVDSRISPERISDFHEAFRDWMETLLPQTAAGLAAAFPTLESRAKEQLKRAGLIHDDSTDHEELGAGWIAGIEFIRQPEALEKLVVIARAELPCGSNDVAYVYDYTVQGRRRVLESRGTREHDEIVSRVQFTPRDANGATVLTILRYGLQCVSNWNLLSYDLFRFPASGPAEPILAGSREWFSYEAEIRSTDSGVLIEFLGHAADAGTLVRPHVLHFRVNGSTVERTDPVAVRPYDFVDEWLGQPWGEMRSRSAQDNSELLGGWHSLLEHNPGEVMFVQQCREVTLWQIGIDLDSIQGVSLAEPLSVYFLVRQADEFKFQMEGVSFERQDGCPGEQYPALGSFTLLPIERLAKPGKDAN